MVFKLVKASSIQYAYIKCGTHTRVFSRTLAHGNSNIEIRQLKIKGKKARRKEWMWKEAQWARKSTVNLNVKSHLTSLVQSLMMMIFFGGRASLSAPLCAHTTDVQVPAFVGPFLFSFSTSPTTAHQAPGRTLFTKEMPNKLTALIKLSNHLRRFTYPIQNHSEWLVMSVPIE